MPSNSILFCAFSLQLTFMEETNRMHGVSVSLPISYGSISFSLGKKADEYNTHQWTCLFLFLLLFLKVLKHALYGHFACYMDVYILIYSVCSKSQWISFITYHRKGTIFSYFCCCVFVYLCLYVFMVVWFK